MALTRPLLSQLNTNIIAFSDNMMVINYANVGNRDMGIVFDRSVNSKPNVALFWQESTSSFTFAQTTSNGLTNANIAVGLTSNVVLGNIILAGNGSAGIFYANGSAFGGGGGGTPGGTPGQIQYNALGTFAGATGFTFTTGNVGVPNLTVNSSMTVSSTLGVTGNINGVSASFTGNVTKGNKNVVTNFTGNSAPTNPQPGDEWYYRPTDTLYKYIFDGNTLNWISISSALYTANTQATANTLALRDSGGNLRATNFIGLASSAKYADLAENYVSDQIYQAGTVVVFGGEEEITTSNTTHDKRVAGVISTSPAYLMNSDCDGLPVAFTGRVPCLVKGPIRKGDLLVTSDEHGVAQALDNAYYQHGCVFGKSLSSLDTDEITTIEVVVGRY